MKKIVLTMGFMLLLLTTPFIAKAESGDYIIHISFYDVNTGETILLPKAECEYYLGNGQKVDLDGVYTKEYYDALKKYLVYDSYEQMPKTLRVIEESIVGWKAVTDEIELEWVSNDGAIEMAAPKVGLIADTEISNVSISASIDGRPEAGIEMILRRDGDSQILQTVYTDENGVAIFEDVELGSYGVYCEAVNQGWYISEDTRGEVHARFTSYYKFEYYFAVKETNNVEGDIFYYNVIKKNGQEEEVFSTINSNNPGMTLNYIEGEKENYYISMTEIPQVYNGEILNNYLITPYVNRTYIVSAVNIPKLKPDKPAIELKTNVATGKIIVSLGKVDNAAKYQIYRAKSKQGTYNLIKTTAKITYTDNDAVAGNRYYYKVRAVSLDGTKGEYSSIKSRVCDCARPVISVRNVASTGKNKVTWGKVTGATSYRVYRATSKAGTYRKMITTSGLSYVDMSAKAGKIYYYKVKAYSGKSSAATSVYSIVKSRTCDIKRPVVKITLSNKKPKLTWSVVTGAKSYKVYRATSKLGKYSLKKTTTSPSYVDTTTKSGKTYYYKVIALSSKTSAANSAYSTVKSIKSK